MKANPTVAKEIAVHFIKLTDSIITPQLMSRTIKQIKGLMEAGFTDEEIQYTIDEAFRLKPNIYSFSYIEACINDVLRKRKEALHKEEMERKKKEVFDAPTIVVSEVLLQDETTNRNRQKAKNFGVRTGERKKHYFDLFEEQ